MADEAEVPETTTAPTEEVEMSVFDALKEVRTLGRLVCGEFRIGKEPWTL